MLNVGLRNFLAKYCGPKNILSQTREYIIKPKQAKKDSTWSESSKAEENATKAKSFP